MTNEELLFAVSTLWVVLAAVLVIFMQAGFAFLEAGLTRMKNVGHVAAKNVRGSDVGVRPVAILQLRGRSTVT